VLHSVVFVLTVLYLCCVWVTVVLVFMLQGVVCVVHMVLQNVDVCCGALPRSPVM